jgi:superfamily II DNA or RNA helicase
MLDQLEVERQRRGNWRNLLVAATGTGKTVVAALDYRRLRQVRGDVSLLFIAHQERILQQARSQFRNVLRDADFGELFVGGVRPEQWRHVFASIQSLAAGEIEEIEPAQFQMVILDEMHHVAAPTYEALMERLTPEVLLGLSATPERADGADTLRHFGGRISAELRLWDALDANLLCPFHYFGLSSDVDFRGLTWERGGYREAELEAAYLDADRDERVKNILGELRRLAPDVHRMKCIGFCVSIRHAVFMADSFNAAGLRAEALTAGTPVDLRNRAVQELRNGSIQALFTVDLFNEGVDIPEVDTLLLLRPTASPTIFIQQLGRGLRLCDGKPCLTVLDFIGQQHRRFRFDRVYRALTGLTLSALERSMREGFASLPSGCYIHLEREPREAILGSLRSAIPRTSSALQTELRTLGDVPLRRFLEETGAELGHLYAGGRSYTALRRAVGYIRGLPSVDEEHVARGLQRLIDLDDPDLLTYQRDLLLQRTPPQYRLLSRRDQRRIRMLFLTLWPEERALGASMQQAIDSLWGMDEIRLEVADLCGILADRIDCLPRRLDLPLLEGTPLQMHCSYSRNEVLAAFDVDRPSSLREGVRYFEAFACDVFFVTLRKLEKEYSPSTLYRDYVLSPTEFHWESQSQTTAASTTGQRYIGHKENGTGVLIFCREARTTEGRTSRYVCLGPADYVSHRGERPMEIIWRLRQPLPTALYERFRAASG